MIDLAPFVTPGSGIWWGQGSAEPTPLVHALLDQAGALGGVRAFCGLSWDEWLTTRLPESVTMTSFGALGALRRLSSAGRLDVVPCNYSALPRLFAQGALPCDVGLVQVSRPDADGAVTLGIGVDYVADALAHTPVLIAEVNARMPSTRGGPRIPLSRFSAVVETDRALLEAPEREPDDVERAVARHVASLVHDGDTIQLGVGSLPAAVLECLSGHADLGVHSGLIGAGIVDLIDKGVVTGAGKQIDAGRVVTGAAMGSRSFYDRIPDLPIDFRPASYTHAPDVLARLRSLVSINAALEVDLTGQVGAEIRRGVYVGAVGGQVDFSRAAAVTGARSIIALRSESGGTSTITTALAGVVTTGRADVDAVVTEHGVAHLRGATLAQRAQRLVAVAAPRHRERLERESAAGAAH